MKNTFFDLQTEYSSWNWEIRDIFVFDYKTGELSIIKAIYSLHLNILWEKNVIR